MKTNVSNLFKMKNNRIIKVLWLAVFCVLAFSLIPLSSAQADILYVDPAGTGVEDWSGAYLTIQAAVAAAAETGDEIWVKQGIYTLGSQINVDKAVSIYGGFPSAMTDPGWEDRYWETFVTTVNGNGAVFHCFYITADATIDGFTITGGSAYGATGIDTRGAGAYINACSATIANCTVESNEALNYGGGMFIINSPSTTITNCIISGNTSEGNGGGFYMESSSNIMITRCSFSANSADHGGAIYLDNTSNTKITRSIFEVNDAENRGGAIYVNDFVSTIITNCTFKENIATELLGNGGGIFNDESDSIITNCEFSGQSVNNDGGAICNSGECIPSITNCTFTGNDADRGGAICNVYSSPIITNCILWEDTATDAGNEIYNYYTSMPVVSYSNIEGSGGSGAWDTLLGTDNGGNIDYDPLFVGGLDYRLLAGSPSIDAGDNTALPDDLADLDGDLDTGEEIPYDLDYNPRRFDDTATVDTGSGTAPIVDMGAYEYSAYTVTFATSGNGSLSDDTTQTITHDGSTAAVTANADTGYSFINWTGDGGFVPTDTNPLTIANVTSDMNITANFTTVLNTYDVTFATSGNGSLSDDTTQTITHDGSTAAVTANPGFGYHFVNWTGTGGFVPTDTNPLTVTNVTSDMTITANFSINQYTVTFLVVGYGTLNGSTPQTIPHGSDCTLVTANADDGYRFIDWTGDYTGTNSSLTVENVTSNMTITANFTTVLSQYLVTFQVNGNGSIDDPTTQPIEHGDDTTAVMATADTGYIFVDWTGTGGFTTTDVNPMIATNVTNDMDITANFQIITFTIDVTSGANGSITPSDSVSVDYGADQTFTISPNVNFVVEDVLVDSVSVGAVTTYTFTSVTGDHTISATFASDGDSDGISDIEEDGAPNGGDGNNDGTNDSLQNDVTSLLTYDGQDYVTIESTSGTILNNVEAIANPSPSDAPSGVDFTHEFFDFTITGVAPPPGVTTVTLYLPAGATPTKYYKYGPLALGDPPEWYEFDFDGTTGAVINGNVITLHFVDGLRGDDDLTANGTIVEPGGPAFAAASSDDPTGGGGGGSSGGCFIATTSSGLPHITAVPMIPYLALMLLLFVIGKAAQRGRKR